MLFALIVSLIRIKIQKDIYTVKQDCRSYFLFYQIDRKALLGQVVSEVHIIDPDNVGKSVFEMQNHSCSVIPDNFVEMDSTKKRLKVHYLIYSLCAI